MARRARVAARGDCRERQMNAAPDPAADGPAERHQRAKALFLEACELPPQEVPAFLEARCGGDHQLREDLTRMLAADDDDGFLKSSALPDAGISLDRIAGERGYKLLRRLGAGGMGEVWLAERADGEFRQQVAIKLMQANAQYSREALRRFRAERQILASLQHPNIARLLDGGRLSNGAPFLVMEYVDGSTIDAWCARHSLDLRGRIRLFLKVCDAVQAAHQALIVHRDLKPGNILVGSDGVPRLLDFGIAKVLNADAFAQSLVHTRTGHAPMTLAYASPEQVRGEAVGTASDVYSLGVVLYELLTGSLPYRTQATDPVGMARAVCEQPPEMPSRVTPGSAASDAAARRRLGWQLRGDLDAILLKALRKEARARYGSVELLAADLKRWLDGLPVLARRGSRAYAARKFAIRHRYAVAAGLTFIALVLGFALDRQHQLIEVQQQRDRAEKLVAFMTGLFDNADPDKAGGRKLSVGDLLDAAAHRALGDAAQQPLDRAALLHTLGSAYLALGDQTRAERLLVQALDLREPDQAPAERAASALQLATLRMQQRRHDDAQAQLDEARALLAAVHGAGHWRVAEADVRRALLQRDRGDPQGAQQALRAVVESMQGALGVPADAPAGHPVLDRERALALAEALLQYGVVAHERKDWAIAEPALRRSMDLLEHWLGDSDPRVGNPLGVLSNLARERGELKDSLALRQRVVELRTAAYGERHWRTGAALVNLGDGLAALARFDEARAVAERATGVLEAALGAGHPYTLIAIGNQATALSGAGDHARALPLAREVLARRLKVLPPDHADVALAHYQVAVTLNKLGQYAESLAAFETAFGIYAAQYGADHPYLDENRISEAEVLIALGRRAEALRRLQVVVAHTGNPDASAPVVAAAQFMLAQQTVRENRAQALQLAQAALAVAEQTGRTDALDPQRIADWLASHPP
jgi:tetratricopeptide (TPR) repeat protein